jgi:hypothetical protein
VIVCAAGEGRRAIVGTEKTEEVDERWGIRLRRVVDSEAVGR